MSVKLDIEESREIVSLLKQLEEIEKEETELISRITKCQDERIALLLRLTQILKLGVRTTG